MMTDDVFSNSVTYEIVVDICNTTSDIQRFGSGRSVKLESSFDQPNWIGKC